MTISVSGPNALDHASLLLGAKAPDWVGGWSSSADFIVAKLQSGEVPFTNIAALAYKIIIFYSRKSNSDIVWSSPQEVFQLLSSQQQADIVSVTKKTQGEETYIINLTKNYDPDILKQLAKLGRPYKVHIADRSLFYAITKFLALDAELSQTSQSETCLEETIHSQRKLFVMIAFGIFVTILQGVFIRNLNKVVLKSAQSANKILFQAQLIMLSILSFSKEILDLSLRVLRNYDFAFFRNKNTRHQLNKIAQENIKVSDGQIANIVNFGFKVQKSYFRYGLICFFSIL